MIAKNIRYILKKNKLTIRQLSQRLSVEYCVLKSWLDVRKIKPSTENIIKLSEIAGVNVIDFISIDISKDGPKKQSQKDLLFSRYLSSPGNIQKAVGLLLGL